MNYICFYHYPCPDGELAKEIFFKKYPDTEFYKWEHSNFKNNIDKLSSLSNRTIVFLDVCPDPKYLKFSNNYIIIDHHENAINKIIPKKNIVKYCDTQKSGCQLCWEYCFNNTKYPISVHHIGNNDIFNFNDKDTEFFINGYNYVIKSNKELLELDKKNYKYDVIIKLGKNNTMYLKEQAEKCFDSHYIYEDTYNDINYQIVGIFCDNSNKLNKYLTEYAKKNFNAYNILRIQKTRSTPISFSLRSIDGTYVDSLARKYNGNGHPLAAGYTQ